MAKQDYHALAYKTLRLIDPNHQSAERCLNLGSLDVAESDQALDALVERLIWQVRKREAKLNSEREELEERARARGCAIAQTPKLKKRHEAIQAEHRELRAAFVLRFDEFKQWNKHADAELRRFSGNGLLDAARYWFAKLQQQHRFSSDRRGYRRYLEFSSKRIEGPSLHSVITERLPALVPEAPRAEHSYIVSTTKSGKTELLKAMLLNYAQMPDYCGVVFLDPGGDVAQQVARWPEFIPSGRLVYLDPYLSRGSTPCINPLDIEEGASDEDRVRLTNQVVAAIGALVEGKVGGTITTNMEACLYPAIRLLVDTPGATLRDLQRLMLGDEALLHLGLNSSEPIVSEFFYSEFGLDNFKGSRQSIAIKLGNILNKGIMERLLCGRTTIDLETLLTDRKVIIVNLAKGSLGTAESSALGTVIVSLVQAIAMNRVRIPKDRRPMTHLIIDECQNFITPELKTIIREARKFNLAVTLAQQEVGAEMPDDLKHTVMKTTNVKIVGRTDTSEHAGAAAIVNVSAADIASLPDAGAFFYKNGTAPPFKLHVRADRIGFKGCVSGELWNQMKAQQLRHFYRSNDRSAESPSDHSPPSADSRSGSGMELL